MVVDGNAIIAGTDNGIFLSTNDGGLWTDVSNGLENRKVSELAIGGSTIYAGTLWSGVWSRTLTEITGIEEYDTQFPATIFPNPFSSTATISFNELQRDCKVKIVDMLGKEIKLIDFSGKQLIIDRDDMKPGMYVVQLIDENGKVSYSKIIVN